MNTQTNAALAAALLMAVSSAVNADSCGGGSQLTGQNLADYIRDKLTCAYKPGNTNGENANERWSSIQDGTGFSGTLYEYARGANHPVDKTKEVGSWALVNDSNVVVDNVADATRVQYNYGIPPAYTYNWEVRETAGGSPQPYEFCDPASSDERIAYAKDAKLWTSGATTNLCVWPGF
jgi:hypothetical protein